MKYSNKQILDSLLNSAGSTAADMTSQLKLYGNGKMDAGIAKVYEAGVGKGSIIAASIIGAADVDEVLLDDVERLLRDERADLVQKAADIHRHDAD